tara:strand:- start:14864 stop:15547 length:684 start_codon:yes stop_codon:yes gene_type:complete
MILSHEHKFVFIAVPKTGSTSVRRSLSKHSDYRARTSERESEGTSLNFHSDFLTIKKYFELQNLDISTYKTFGFSRNPWDREVSFFKYFKKFIAIYKQLDLQEKSLEIDYSFAKYCYDRKSQASDFGEFLKNRSLYRKCCFDFLYDFQNDTEVDFIGSLENFDDDLNHIFSILNLPLDRVFHTNKTSRSAGQIHYSSFYKKQQWIDLVAEVYSKDIERFNYQFEKQT